MITYSVLANTNEDLAAQIVVPNIQGYLTTSFCMLMFQLKKYHLKAYNEVKFNFCLFFLVEFLISTLTSITSLVNAYPNFTKYFNLTIYAGLYPL